MDVHIRWMIRRDFQAVLQIEHAVFDYPWSERDLAGWLQARNCIGMVAEHAEHIVGFMVYELFPSHLHVVNFAVAPGFQRRGVGQQMVDKLVGKLSSQRRTMTTAVRERNLPAQLFFRAAGFRATQVMRSYYEDSSEDAFAMEYRYLAPPAKTNAR